MDTNYRKPYKNSVENKDEELEVSKEQQENPRSQ